MNRCHPPLADLGGNDPTRSGSMLANASARMGVEPAKKAAHDASTPLLAMRSLLREGCCGVARLVARTAALDS